jgi:hypothetical protein
VIDELDKDVRFETAVVKIIDMPHKLVQALLHEIWSYDSYQAQLDLTLENLLSDLEHVLLLLGHANHFFVARLL